MFLGITRFSLFVPNSTGWNLSKNAKDVNSIEEYKNMLFDPNRLDERVNIFFNISLPSLRIMKEGYSYIHVLQISDQLPDIFKDKIYNLAKDYSFLKIQEFDINGNASIELFDIVRQNRVLSYKEEPIGVFNLDDDDLLAIDFFKKCKKYLNLNYTGHCLSFGYGITGLMKGADVIEFKESYRPKINIGLMRIGTISNKGISLPRNGNHILLDKYSPTIVDSREVMYFWVRHFNQDSSNSFNNPERQLKIILNNLSDFKDINLTSEILSKFPTVNFNPSEDLREEVVVGKLLSSRDLYQIRLKVTSSRVFLIVHYEVKNIDKVIDPLKVGLVSFKFNKDLTGFSGLSKSPNPEIGFFRYLSGRDIHNSFFITLDLPDGVSLESISISRWQHKSHLLVNKVIAYKF